MSIQERSASPGPKVIIGCPVYKRAWCLDAWFDHIERQDFPLSDIGFVFELGFGDEETHDKLWLWHARHPEVSVFDGVIREDLRHEAHPENGRQWSSGKYWKMVNMRNALLDRVRVYKPERYYSLDSDILLEDPTTISKLYEYTKSFNAVGTLSYMTPEGTGFPSVMTWRKAIGGSAYRAENYPIGELFKADIIMASKMMDEKAYRLSSYNWHRQGEDLGWSTVCGQRGLTLACASDIFTAHIMQPHLLEGYLAHGDVRSTNKLV